MTLFTIAQQMSIQLLFLFITWHFYFGQTHLLHELLLGEFIPIICRLFQSPFVLHVVFSARRKELQPLTYKLCFSESAVTAAINTQLVYVDSSVFVLLILYLF